MLSCSLMPLMYSFFAIIVRKMKNPCYVEFGKLGELCEIGSRGVDCLCELVYLVNAVNNIY